MNPRRLHSATIFSIVTTSPPAPEDGADVEGSVPGASEVAGAGSLIAAEHGNGASPPPVSSPRVARILIVGGGCRGRLLASQLIAEGHTVRITTRAPARCVPIEQTGAECFVGTPDRLATLRGALENVTVACWLLGGAIGSGEHLRALHGSRLEYFLGETVDTTVRGFVYEAAGSVAPELLATGAGIVVAAGERNALPTALLRADPAAPEAWLAEAAGAVRGLLEGRPSRADGQAAGRPLR
jgi:hypothetical protein